MSRRAGSFSWPVRRLFPFLPENVGGRTGPAHAHEPAQHRARPRLAPERAGRRLLRDTPTVSAARPRAIAATSVVTCRRIVPPPRSYISKLQVASAGCCACRNHRFSTTCRTNQGLPRTAAPAPRASRRELPRQEAPDRRRADSPSKSGFIRTEPVAGVADVGIHNRRRGHQS